MKPIPYARQEISESDIEAVIDVLRSDFLTQGPAIERFENAVAEYCGAKYAVAVANATGALHIACLALGLKPGDRLWTTPNTFVASANCGLYCGAEVNFVDIDASTLNLSVTALEKELAAAEGEGRLPSVVVPVHFSGRSCEMDQIGGLARRYGFRVLEDASHAIGGRFRGRKIGSCDHSDLTVFSFHPVKVMTTGEGGMVVTNDRTLYEKLQLLRTHGVTRDPALMKGESQGPWYYEQVELGFNYRITDIQAALGVNQLLRIDEFVSRRRAIADRYDEALRGLPLTLPARDAENGSAHHLYAVRLNTSRLRKPHRRVFEELRAAGILVNLHYMPVHLQPYYRDLGFGPGQFPEAEKYSSEAISLPMYAGLTKVQQERVIATLLRVVES